MMWYNAIFRISSSGRKHSMKPSDSITNSELSGSSCGSPHGHNGARDIVGAVHGDFAGREVEPILNITADDDDFDEKFVVFGFRDRGGYDFGCQSGEGVDDDFFLGT
jgi:hypothetical protein